MTIIGAGAQRRSPRKRPSLPETPERPDPVAKKSRFCEVQPSSSKHQASHARLPDPRSPLESRQNFMHRAGIEEPFELEKPFDSPIPRRSPRFNSSREPKSSERRQWRTAREDVRRLEQDRPHRVLSNAKFTKAAKQYMQQELKHLISKWEKEKQLALKPADNLRESLDEFTQKIDEIPRSFTNYSDRRKTKVGDRNFETWLRETNAVGRDILKPQAFNHRTGRSAAEQKYQILDTDLYLTLVASEFEFWRKQKLHPLILKNIKSAIEGKAGNPNQVMISKIHHIHAMHADVACVNDLLDSLDTLKNRLTGRQFEQILGSNRLIRKWNSKVRSMIKELPTTNGMMRSMTFAAQDFPKSRELKGVAKCACVRCNEALTGISGLRVFIATEKGTFTHGSSASRSHTGRRLAFT